METRLPQGVGGPVVPASMENTNRGAVRVENDGPVFPVPMINEIAAVVIGRALSDPDAGPELEEAMLKSLASIDNLKIVYRQNTADELNIVVPDFPDFSIALQRLKENELAGIHGGEIFGALSGALTGMTLSWIGCQVGIGLIFGTGLTLGGTVIGATSAATFAGALVVAGMIAMPIGLSVIGATAAAGIGVGIAAGVGAFNSNSGNSVNVAFAS